MENLEGMHGAKVSSQETTESSQYDKEFAQALKFLEQYNNKDFADLLKGLTDEVRISLFNDLGGSWSEVLEAKNNMEKAREAIKNYEENMPNSTESISVEKTEQKREKRRQAVKDLKASVIY